jgi:hypothetical protein
MINSERYYIPEQLAGVFHLSNTDKQKGLRPIVNDVDVIGNKFHSQLMNGINGKDLAWPPIWVDDILGALDVVYSLCDEHQQNWECGSLCKEQPPTVTGLELEYIVGNEELLEDDDFKETFLERAQSTPEKYLTKNLKCIFYDAEEDVCKLETKPLACRLQNQDIDEQWENLFDIFYYVIDKASLLENSLLYGTLFTHFLINYYYIFPYFQKSSDYKSEKELYDDIYRNLEKKDVAQSWMKIGFQPHNYILSVDDNIKRLYEKKEVKRNDPCPCGSGKKYKYCCL